MRSDGSRFTFGVWGLRRVRLTLLLCSQLSATVPAGIAAKAVTFGGLKLQGFASVLISVTSFKASECRSYFFFPSYIEPVALASKHFAADLRLRGPVVEAEVEIKGP